MPGRRQPRALDAVAFPCQSPSCLLAGRFEEERVPLAGYLFYFCLVRLKHRPCLGLVRVPGQLNAESAKSRVKRDE